MMKSKRRLWALGLGTSLVMSGGCRPGLLEDCGGDLTCLVEKLCEQSDDDFWCELLGVANPNPDTDGPCLCGDLSDAGVDDTVNDEDFAVFAACYELTEPTDDCPRETLECADLDQSGEVDLIDFHTFVQVVGTNNTNEPPNCLE